jgi:hypothetical protein
MALTLKAELKFSQPPLRIIQSKKYVEDSYIFEGLLECIISVTYIIK